MKKRKIEYVNVFIGSTGSAHALVGPQLPHGMAKLGPDTSNLPCGGYDYYDKYIQGFSHTHIEGAGGKGGRGHIMVMPTTGELETDERVFHSTYDHAEESAKVGYYQVRLSDYDINVELAATAHCGYHRYSFPKAEKAHVLVDVGHTLGKIYQQSLSADVEMLDNKTFRGVGKYPLEKDPNNFITVHFHGELSIACESFGTWSDNEVSQDSSAKGKTAGVYCRYSFEEPTTVEVKVGISYISCEKAKWMLDKEMPTFDLERYVIEAQDAWEDVLSRVDVSGNDEDYHIQFYSALYRAFNQPTDYNEYDEYFDGSAEPHFHKSGGEAFYSDDWALWDTFRTTHPLQNLLEPERVRGKINTFLNIYKHSGWLPMCTAPSTGFNQIMIGHNASSILLDMLSFDPDFDNKELLFEAVLKQATQVSDIPNKRMCGAHTHYLEQGYVAHDDTDNNFSVSETLEYIYADWCVAQIAKKLGKDNYHEQFMKKAQNYKKLFDKSRGFMVPKNKDGNFIEKFNPKDAFKNGFCETTSWEYTFFVPHDVQGLINHIGGDEEFISRLDEFFGDKIYNNQNETGIQAPFFYNYAGAAGKTQKTTLCLVRDYHFNKVDGLYGEDDAGAMSAWYVFASAGLYPVCVGDGLYAITSPNFESVSVKLLDNTFTIECENFGTQNIYIQKALLNGEPHEKPFITLEQLQAGGKLTLFMGENESSWGTDKKQVALSQTMSELNARLSNISIKDKKASGEFILAVTVENIGEDGTWIAKVYANCSSAAKQRVPLLKGETKTVEISCKAYNEGENCITIDGIDCGIVTVCEGPLQEVIVLHDPTLNRLFSASDEIETVEVTAQLFNKGRHSAIIDVPLHANDVEVASKRICIESGQSKTVTFTCRPEKEGAYRMKVLNSGECLYSVTRPLDDKFCVVTGIQEGIPDAVVTQQGENIYMQVWGYQSNKKCAYVFDKTPITGDFSASVCVRYSDNTNPYAPTGMSVKNELTGTVAPGQFSLTCGAQRGFLLESCGNVSWHKRDDVGYQGCPYYPFWHKVEKKAGKLSAYYSFDNKNWELMNEITLEEANETQYVGLLGNAGNGVPRIIHYSDFIIEKL